MAKLLDGSSDDIIRTNHKCLCDEGMSEAQAWSVVLKKANKTKAAERAKQGVMAKPRKNKVQVK
jgi:hypothetical protein